MTDVESDRSNSTLKIQYLAPAAGTDSLIVQQSHFFLLHDEVWHWTVAEADSHPVCSETSLRSVIQEFAKQAEPFEFAHIQIEVASPAPDTFSVHEIFEEISHLFDDTPSFGMSINTARFMVIPLVT